MGLKLEQCRKQVVDLRAQITDLHSRLQGLKGDNADLKLQLGECQQKLAAAQARIEELENPKSASPILGMFFRDGIQNEGAGDNPLVTIGEMIRVNPDRDWMWRVYPEVVNTSPGDRGRMMAAMDRGESIYISWHMPKDFAAVVRGDYDADIHAAAVHTMNMIANETQIVLGYQHEPENDELAQIADEGQRADRFVAMWMHVADIFASVGVTQERLKANGGFLTGPALTEAYYRTINGRFRGELWLAIPNDRFGPMAVDAYARYGSMNRDRTKRLGTKVPEGITDIYGDALVKAKERGKQLAILETGMHEDTRDGDYFIPDRKAGFFRDVVTLAETGQIAAYCYSNVDAIFAGDWIQKYRVNTTPSSDEAFKALSRDAVWQ